MSRHIASVVCFFIVLMTSRHVTGQTHDVAQLNRRLTIIKSSVDRDISDMKLQILELKMSVDQIMVSMGNASDGSLVVEPFIDYEQGKTGVSQKDITDLKTTLTTHESRLERLSTTVNHIQVEKSEIKRKVDKLGDKEDEEKRNELINNLKAELLLQLNADIEAKCGDRVTALQKTFEETANVMTKGYKDLKTHLNGISKFDSQPVDRNEMRVFVLDQMNNLSQSVISEHNKLSARIGKADENIVRLDGEANKLDGFLRVIEELKTKSEKCCTDLSGQQPKSANGYRVRPLFGSDLEKHIKVGTRVVRGADWRYGDTDGGGPGTVTTVSKNKYASVKWDKGVLAGYRNGASGKYDLLILVDEQ